MSVSQENSQKSEQAKEKGNTCFRNQDYPAALNHYNTALTYNPFDAALYFNRALLYIKGSQYEKAVEDCNKTLNLNKEYFKAYERRAQAYFGLNDYSRAIKDLITTLELEPDKRQARELLEKCYELKINQRKIVKPVPGKTFEPPLENEEELDEDLLLYDSIEHLEKVVNSSVKLHAKAKEYRKLGKYRSSAQESIKGLSLLIQVTAKKTEKVEKIKLNLVKALFKSYTYLLEFDQALETITTTLKLPFINEQSQSLLHEHKSSIYHIQGSYQQALNELLPLKKVHNNEKIKHDRKTSMLKYLLSPQDQTVKTVEDKKLEHSLKNWVKEKEEAIQLFKKNKFEDALRMFDTIIYDILKRYDEAEILACKKLKDLIVALYNNKAVGFSRIGKHHFSCKECLKVFVYEFENLKAWFRFGKNMMELEEFYLARQCFRKIIEKDKPNEDFVKELKNVEEKIKIMEGEGSGGVGIIDLEKKSEEIGEVVKGKEVSRVLTVEDEVKCGVPQAIRNEFANEKEVLVKKNDSFVENPELLNEKKKSTDNS